MLIPHLTFYSLGISELEDINTVLVVVDLFEAVHHLCRHGEEQTFEVDLRLVCKLFVGAHFLWVCFVVDLVDLTQHTVLEAEVVLVLAVDAALGVF